MSRLRDRAYRKDFYYRSAKMEHYVARSVYKLTEIDHRFHLFKSGQYILDLGCAPGSWLQYASSRVGDRGYIVGVDRFPLQAQLPSNAVVFTGDIFELEPHDLVQQLPRASQRFHVILSDMAPDTTGIAITDHARSETLVRRALAIALAVGESGHHLLVKLLMGEGLKCLMESFKDYYQEVEVIRPKATRKPSSEVFLLGLRKKRVL